MMKSTLLVALCLLPLVVVVNAVRPLSNGPLLVEGQVYCDNCRAGFFTPSSTYMSGASVRLECRSRDSKKIIQTEEAYTDNNGTYRINVNEDHGNQICEIVLVGVTKSSPLHDCNLIVPGADRARVVLNTNNGIATNIRYVNSLALLRETPVAGCATLLQAYDAFNNDDV